jgi:hypothetical protein
MTTFKHYGTMLILLILQLAPILAQTGPKSCERLVITGNVIAFAGHGIPTAMLIAGDGEEMPVVIGPKGRFWVNVPVGTEYRIVFTRSGCTSKAIHVCIPGAHPKSMAKRIRFDVELFAGDAPKVIAAGRISFAKGTGRMVVEYGNRPEINDPPPDQMNTFVVMRRKKG